MGGKSSRRADDPSYLVDGRVEGRAMLSRDRLHSARSDSNSSSDGSDAGSQDAGLLQTSAGPTRYRHHYRERLMTITAIAVAVSLFLLIAKYAFEFSDPSRATAFDIEEGAGLRGSATHKTIPQLVGDSFQEGLSQAGAVESNPAVKLHFLFLAVDDVSHAEIWRDFFADSDKSSFMIWLHCKHIHMCLRGDFVKKLGKLVRLVPTVPAEYCTDLVSPEVQLLRSALSGEVSTGAKDKFTLVSDSTLPVKPFSAIYFALMNNEGSDLCVYPLCPQNVCRFHQWFWAKGTVMRNGDVASLPMTSQFATLNRRDAEKFVSEWEATGERSWGPVTSQVWMDQSNSVENDTRIEPIWNIPVLSDGGHGGRQMQTAPSNEFSGWQTCTDESVLFSIIHGSAVLRQGTSVEIPGWGMLHGDDYYNSRPQGRCTNYFSFSMWSLDDRRLESALVVDTASTVRLGQPGSTHPLEFLNLSRQAIAMLRGSEWLFARKFASDATLPGYSDIVFK